MTAILLAPVSTGFKKNSHINLSVAINKTEAQTTEKNLVGGEYLDISIPSQGIGANSAIFIINAFNTAGDNSSYKINTTLFRTSDNKEITTEGYSFVSFFPDDPAQKGKVEVKMSICYGGATPNSSQPKCSTTDRRLLIPKTNYILEVKFEKESNNSNQSTYSVPFKTGDKTTSGLITDDISVSVSDDFNIGCDALRASTWFTNCIASGLYYIVFVPLAEIAKLTAKILDFFVYYSTNSNSYTAQFVEKGWGAVRDIANIFFIITLLFIAVKTVLGLNVSNNKKLISMVIVIALVINFSLFTTKVVIDASNILAKVFYNNIKSVGEDDNPKSPGYEGEKSISVGLVRQFNPAQMITETGNEITQNLGFFVTITLLSIALMGYMIYIFLSIALLFVSRVVSLWLAMIFSPIAFISYAVPFEIPGFGHKEWWTNLIEAAMLAPLFIFFLYIIIMFGDFFGLIIYDVKKSTDILDAAMKTFIPFAIIFVLLQKAKKLSVKYAGEIGEAFNKAGTAITGAVLGAGVATVTGGAGLALRGTIGKASAAAANSSWARKWEATGYGGGLAKKVMEKGASASFDVRGIKAVSGAMGKADLSFNKAPEGGFEGARKRKVEKRQKRAQELKVGEDEKLKQTLNKTEADLQELLSKNAKEIETVDKLIEKKRQEASDAERKLKAASTPTEKSTAQTNLRNANNELEDAKNRKTDLREGRNHTDLYGVTAGTTYNYATSAVTTAGGTIDNLEKQKRVDVQNITDENRDRFNKFAKTIEGNKFTKIFASRGGKANREAAHKIRMEVKLDSGTKT